MSIQDLDKEIARRKSRAPAEPLDVEIPDPIDRDLGGIIHRFERMKEEARLFAESLRPEFDELPDVIGCMDHEFVERSKVFEQTVTESRRSGYFVAVYTPCQECAEDAKTAAMRRRLRLKGVPERVIDATFENFEIDTPAKQSACYLVKTWMGKLGGFLILHGTTGTGKGHLAAACMRRGVDEKTDGIEHRVFDGVFITHPDMLTDLRSSYQLKTTAELLERWKEAPLLIIDELGVSAGGSDEGPMLYQVLADRHDKRRKVIITSNLDLDEIKKSLGYRLVDRIAEDLVCVSMRWPSKRTGR